MPRRCVGLIGEGQGPLIRVGEVCRIEVKGLGDGLAHAHVQRARETIPHALSSDGIHNVSEIPIDYVQIEYRGSSPSFICNVLIGD